MSNKYNTLKKNTIIFTLGNIGSSLISFLLIPLFTNYLTSAEYGRIDFVTMVVTLCVPVITLNLIEALVRFGIDKSYESDEVISTIIITVFAIHMFNLIIIILLSFIGVRSKLLSFYCFMFFITSIYQLLQQYTRAIEKLKVYAMSDMLYTFIFSILNVIFIVKYSMGIKGYFIAYISTNIILSIFLVIVVKLYNDIKASLFSIKYLKEFIVYSTPLIPNNLSWWIINVSDRYLVKVFSGYSQLGLYSISNKIPQVLNVLYGIFFKAWQISSIKELGKEDTEEFYTKVFEYISKFMFSIGMVVLLFINLIFYIMIGKEFKESISFVPILILAAVFAAFASFIGTIYIAYKKSKNVLKSTIISAAINIAINIVFIPKFGTIVACISTLISYITLFIYRCCDSKKFMKIRLNYKDIIFSTTLFIFMIININIFKLSYKTIFINFIIVILYSIYNIKALKVLVKYIIQR